MNGLVVLVVWKVFRIWFVGLFGCWLSDVLCGLLGIGWLMVISVLFIGGVGFVGVFVVVIGVVIGVGVGVGGGVVEVILVRLSGLLSGNFC